MATWKKIIVSGSDAHLKTGNFSSHVTASGNISGSALSTGSFGRLEATVLAGDGSGITNLTAAAISSYTNASNNRVVTSVDGSTVNAEANLEFDGTDLLVKGGGKVAFRDNGGEYIYSVSDNILGLAAGSEIDLTATTIDLNGNLDVSGNVTSSYISSSNDIEAQGQIIGNEVIGSAISSSGNITGSDVFASSGIYGTLQTASQTNITGVGTISTGVWNGTAVDTAYIDATLTSQTSILNDSLKIGRADGEDSIDFGSDDTILFDIDDTERLRVDAAGIDVTGNITATGNATITGDLTVNGTTTTLSTTNLSVGDQFIFAATGSAGSNVDAGIIVQSGSAVDSGSALYHDINDQRWAVAMNVKDTATSVTPLQHVVTVSGSVATNPNSTSGSYGIGEMWITDDEDIWVRTA